MKRKLLMPVVMGLLLGFGSTAFGQENVTVVAPASEVAEGLDLKAVCELFKDSENLEKFEKSLNDPDVGINNLDLDENGEVDFIRVMEETEDDTRIVVLQVPMGEDEFQDVATIEVEKSGEDYNVQAHGNEVLYGVNYYVVPAPVYISTWPVITWMYGPVYRPYRSGFYFGYYPRWYRPYRPVSVGVYRTRTVRIHGKTTYTVSRTSRVRTVSKVKYTPRTSTRITRRTRVTNTNKALPGTTGTTKVTKSRATSVGGKTVKKDTKKVTRSKTATGRTTVRKSSRKTKVKKRTR